MEISVDKDLKKALEASSKDFKATLFIENLNLNEYNKGYKIDNIQLDIE